MAAGRARFLNDRGGRCCRQRCGPVGIGSGGEGQGEGGNVGVSGSGGVGMGSGVGKRPGRFTNCACVILQKKSGHRRDRA